MKFVCPHCQQKYELDESYDGQIAQCTRCQKDFTLTAAKGNDSTPLATNEEKKYPYDFIPYLG